MDADSLRLPAGQDELVAHVASANSNTVIVTGGSGPIVMPWAHDVAAILHMGQAGERFASAAANILAGNAEPGGRLPFSIPTTHSDVPLQDRGYPGSDDVAEYSEGVGVGYRGYELAGTTPAFHFGHGLSYTDFDVVDAEFRVDSGAVVFSAWIVNIGSRAGKCVVQLYAAALDRPGDVASLRGFTSTKVDSGAKQQIRIAVPIADFQTYDEALSAWVLPQSLRVSCGMSRGDLRWSEDIALRS
jgi:beta-glucosidase